MRVLVNNAGIGVNAPVEVFAIDEWRRLFEVNFFGHIAVIQTLLPALIRNKGRVVNISSVGGKIAMAAYGPYAGTKFALEAVSDALRREVEPLGVKVIVVEPAAVTTEMLGRVAVTGERIISGMTTEQHGRYAALIHSIISQAEAAASRRSPTAALAQEDELNPRPRKSTPLRRTTGTQNRLLRSVRYPLHCGSPPA